MEKFPKGDDDSQLELRLGPPGSEEWTIKKGDSKNNPISETDEYFSNMKKIEKRWVMNNNGSQKTQQQFLRIQTRPQSLPVMAPELSQPCNSRGVEVLQHAENRAFSAASVDTAVPNSSQKSAAPASVVGWPPIHSFRKNLASSSSSKPHSKSQKLVPNKAVNEKPDESSRKGLYVKINMDGIPIGRKVDLKAYESYERLQVAVDELFSGLLAVQGGSFFGGTENRQEGEKAITGLLDGSGEYTLVYEDNEGDKLLVGDVPWGMFVSSVRRLRVLKRSELSKMCLGSKQHKIPFNVASR